MPGRIGVHSPLSTYDTKPHYGTSYTDTYSRPLSNSSSRSLSQSRVPDRGRYSSSFDSSSTLTRSRPLPAGPGPQDEYGRKYEFRPKSRNSSVSRIGPLKADHNSPIKTSSYNGTSDCALLNRPKRTNSVHNLSAEFERKLSTSKTSSVASSRKYNSIGDIKSRTRNYDSKVDDVYENSVPDGVTSPSRYLSRTSSYDYKSTRGSDRTSSLPPVTHTERGRARERISDDVTSTTSERISRRSSSTSAASISSQGYSSPRQSGSTWEQGGNAGMRNLGNTCFMNSVLQCLSNTKPLLEYCMQERHIMDINKTTSSLKGALINAFVSLLNSIWKSGESYVVPTSLKAQIQKFAPRFGGYNQQDAQELLIYVLEGLHQDVNRVTTKVKREIIDDKQLEGLNTYEQSRLYWRNYTKVDDSFIVDTFVGQLRSTLRCTECEHKSLTFDPFWELSVPLPKRGYSDVSLQDCFNLFTVEEMLEGDERPKCEKCKTRRKCGKSFSIQKFPQVLVVTLKRFSQERFMRSKLSTNVTFPVNNLDLTEYAADKSGGPFIYNLYGVSNHSGSTYSGHYTAYAKHPYNHQWQLFNDTRVSKVSERQVVSSEAYLLFYELTSSGTRSSRL
ncbi:unnamed protein product [Owenia fusiformis]|uniref:Ubiquitin carboxyl-terminal hydrolase n=1 Tax=Owenia fusiformis TaxID=6347 RepID=A0A8J1XU28_OWEFU|nr:unnamed protein product [Owenia fusiformis]